MDSIVNLRKNIDDIDKKIMSLLNLRFESSVQIGLEKGKSSISVLDSKRETQIMKKSDEYTYQKAIKEVYKTIMKESKFLQRK